MEIKRVWAVYFSATGTTEKVVQTMAAAAAEELGAAQESVNFTPSSARAQQYRFDREDLVFFGTPVYAGRVPNKLLPFVQSGFAGGDALAVPVSMFGNRSFDNGLIELRNELENNGFHTVAGAAFVGQHAFSDIMAKGRPNAEDLAQARDFARQVAQKVRSLSEYPAPIAVKGEDPVGPYYTPKGLDGKPAVFLKAKPKTDPERCIHCGLCAAVCPLDSIDPEDVSQVPGVCIKCHACIRRCPTGAKYLDDPAFLSHKAALERDFLRPADNACFL